LGSCLLLDKVDISDRNLNSLQYTSKAVDSARAARKKRWICFFIILVIVIIIAIVVAIEVTKNINTNKTTKTTVAPAATTTVCCIL
jgi:syntaxin 1B/2/3